MSKITRLFSLFLVFSAAMAFMVAFSSSVFAEKASCSGVISGNVSSPNVNAGTTYFDEGDTTADKVSIMGVAGGAVAPDVPYAACSSEGDNAAVYERDAELSAFVGEYQLKGWAWNDNLGFVSFYCSGGENGKNEEIDCGPHPYGVEIGAESGGLRDLSGYAWNSSFGWIKFGDYAFPNGKVTMDVDGNLSGYAWTEAGVWMNFTGIKIGVPIDPDVPPVPPVDDPQWCPRAGVCIEIDPVYDNPELDIEGLGRVADGRDGYYVHLYLRDENGEVGFEDNYDMNYFWENMIFSWKDTVKTNQLRGTVAPDDLSTEQYPFASGLGAVTYKPLIGADFEPAADAGHYVSKEPISAYAPTTAGNVSYTTSTIPRYTFENETFLNLKYDDIERNDLILEHVEVGLKPAGGGDGVTDVIYPNGNIHGAEFKFRPVVELNPLYVADEQDLIEMIRGVPVVFTVGAATHTTTIVENPGDPEPLEELTSPERMSINFSGVHSAKEVEVVVDSAGMPHIFSASNNNAGICGGNELYVHAYKEADVWNYECVDQTHSSYKRKGVASVITQSGDSEIMYVAYAKTASGYYGSSYSDWVLKKKVKGSGQVWAKVDWQIVDWAIEGGGRIGGSVRALDLTMDSEGKLAMAIIVSYGSNNVKGYFYYDENGNGEFDEARIVIDENLQEYMNWNEYKIELKPIPGAVGKFGIVYGSGPRNYKGSLGSRIYYREFGVEGRGWGEARTVCDAPRGYGCFSPSFDFKSNGNPIISYAYWDSSNAPVEVKTRTYDRASGRFSSEYDVASYRRNNTWSDTDILVDGGGLVHLAYGAAAHGIYLTSSTGISGWTSSQNTRAIDYYIEMVARGSFVYLVGDSESSVYYSTNDPGVTTPVPADGDDGEEGEGGLPSYVSDVVIDLILYYSTEQTLEECGGVPIMPEEVSCEEGDDTCVPDNCPDGQELADDGTCVDEEETSQFFAFRFLDNEGEIALGNQRDDSEEVETVGDRYWFPFSAFDDGGIQVGAVAELQSVEEGLCKVVAAPSFYSEVKYNVTVEGAATLIQYYSNKLPRIAGSFIANPALVVKGNIYAQKTFSPSVEVESVTTSGDINVNIVRDVVTENLRTYLKDSVGIQAGAACTIDALDDLSFSGGGCSDLQYQKYKIGDENVIHFNGTPVVLNLTGGWEKDHVVVVENENLFIDGDAYNPNGGGNLAVVALRRHGHSYGMSGNVYVGPNVKNVQANIMSDGTLFSYDGNQGNINEVSGEPDWPVTFNDRLAMFGKQFRLEGSISSRNTIGGADLIDYLLLGTGEVLTEPPFSSEERVRAQKYDLNYFRMFRLELEMASSGYAVDQACGVALDPEDIIWLNKKENGTLTPEEEAAFPAYLNSCNGINPHKQYNALTGTDGDLMPPSVQTGVYAEGSLDSAGEPLDTDPVYVEYVPSDSFVFSQVGDVSVSN